MQQRQLEHYLRYRDLVYEVIYDMLYSSSNRPIQQRISKAALENELADQFANNEIKIPYEYVFTTNTGRTIYASKNANPSSVANSYSQAVFRNDSPNRMGVIRVSFPTLDDYIADTVDFMIPSLIFITIMMVAKLKNTVLAHMFTTDVNLWNSVCLMNL